MRTLILLAALALFSCQQKEDKSVVDPALKPDSVLQDAAAKKVGDVTDSHGCQTTAGYTWSQLEGDCIRVFESAKRFDPVENDGNAVMSAFVIFEEDGNRAELFVMSEEKPVILTRKAEGESYLGGDWELFAWKGYVLRYKGRNMFTAQ